MSGIEKLQYDHGQILYILDLGLRKCFFMKTLIILPRFHEKALNRSRDIKVFSFREEDIRVHSPSPAPLYGRRVY